jgi:hypothetical protein
LTIGLLPFAFLEERMSKNEVETLEQVAKAIALQASEAYLSVPNRNAASGVTSAHDIDAIKMRLHDIVRHAERIAAIANSVASRA